MRANVWTYPGTNEFKSGRLGDLALHPTVKPMALVVDALRDCSMKGDIVLDPFMGSGTTIMAAEKIARHAYGMDLDPLYVDVAVRRWKAATKLDVTLAGDGRTFEEISAERANEDAAPATCGSAPGMEASPAWGLTVSGDSVTEPEDEAWVALAEGRPRERAPSTNTRGKP
jgi:hypothetical protein